MGRLYWIVEESVWLAGDARDRQGQHADKKEKTGKSPPIGLYDDHGASRYSNLLLQPPESR